MKKDQENLPIKGLRRTFSKRLTPLEELKEAKDSLAYWWYRTLKESASYRDCCLTGGLGDLAKTYQNFGDIFDTYTDFDKWWFEKGRGLLQLKKAPPKVKKIEDYSQYRRATNKEDVLIIEIPLTIRKQTATKDIRKLLNEAHRNLYGAEVIDIYKKADTKLKFNKSKIRKSTIETLLNIHRIRRRRPNATLFEIATIAKIELDLYARATDVTDLNEKVEAEDHKRRMTIAASRYVKQAVNLIYNAERGIFPSIKKELINVT